MKLKRCYRRKKKRQNTRRHFFQKLRKRAKAQQGKVQSNRHIIAASHENPIRHENKFVVVDGGVGVAPPLFTDAEDIVTLTKDDFDVVDHHINDPSK